MNKDDIKKRIMEDPDFIKSVKYGNSLSKFMANSEGSVENATIARLLMFTEKEIEEMYLEAVKLLKSKMT